MLIDLTDPSFPSLDLQAHLTRLAIRMPREGQIWYFGDPPAGASQIRINLGRRHGLFFLEPQGITFRYYELDWYIFWLKAEEIAGDVRLRHLGATWGMQFFLRREPKYHSGDGNRLAEFEMTLPYYQGGPPPPLPTPPRTAWDRLGEEEECNEKQAP